MSAVTDRDGGRCVACGQPAPQVRLAEHHRILGRRADNRPSNTLTLCGTGNVPPGCHGTAHQHPRRARSRGYIVSRHGPAAATLTIPVWYNQPALARVGWFLLDDDYNLIPHEGVPCPA